MPQFAKIHIEISNLCNLQCSFCPEVIRPKKMMSVDEFKHIVEQAAPLTEHICLHLMGEPLLHPDFPAMIESCKAQGAKIFLVTNGVKLKESMFELLIDPVFHQINFSLHSFVDNFPDRDPSDYLQMIFKFTRLAQSIRPDLYINYRLWNLQDTKGQNSNNLGLLAKIEAEFGVSVPRNSNVKNKKSFKIKDRLYMHFDTEFTWPNLDLPLVGTKGTCYGLSSHFGILADGTVVPCCLDKEGIIPLGNAHQDSLINILNSDRAQKMLKGFKSGNLIENLCQHCPYIERFAGA